MAGIAAGFAGDPDGAVDQRDSVLFSMGLQEICASHNVASEFQGRAFQKGKSKSCKPLKALFSRYSVSLWTNSIGQSESQGQPKFNVVRLWLTGYHLWGLIGKHFEKLRLHQ